MTKFMKVNAGTFGHTLLRKSDLSILQPKARLLDKNSSLDATLGVAKFITIIVPCKASYVRLLYLTI
jgi:hypothetical protein